MLASLASGLIAVRNRPALSIHREEKGGSALTGHGSALPGGDVGARGRSSPPISSKNTEVAQMREEEQKAALREAVLEAARQGAAGGRSRSRDNPLYRPPTAAGAAWTHLYGVCRSLSEWATNANLSLARDGRAEREDDQAANAEAVQRASDVLCKFLGDIHAQ